jgi:hypothetical protein
VIYSGGNDTVTLDMGTTTISSLTLGGAYNGYTSELTDAGTARVLNLTNALTIGQNGELYFYGGSSITAGADSSNAGTIYLYSGSTLNINGNFNNSNLAYAVDGGSVINITGNLANSGQFYEYGGGTANIGGNVTNNDELNTSQGTLNIAGMLTNNSTFQVSNSGVVTVGTLVNNSTVSVDASSTLNLTNQPGGITDVASGTSYSIAGSFTAGANNAFYQLNSVEGQVYLYGQNFTITPGSGTLTIGSNGDLTANYNPYTGVGTNLTIAGNVNNSGLLATGYNYGGGNNVLTIAGNLTNNANSNFYVYSSGDTANVGSLTNSGYTYVSSGATLNLTNQPGGITDAAAGSRFDLYGTFTDQVNYASGFANLTSIEGAVNLFSQNLTINPNGGTDHRQ